MRHPSRPAGTRPNFETPSGGIASGSIQNASLGSAPGEAFTVRATRLVRRPWFWLVVGLVAAAALAGVLLWVRRDATSARIRESGVWRVGMDPSFPPFEFIDPSTGKPIGLDVDLVDAIAARWGVRAEIVSLGFDELVDAVAARRVDSAVSALPVFDWRTQEVAFSAPYIDAGIVLAVPRGSPIRGPDDLAGRRVAAEWGSEGDAQSRELQRRLEGNLELVLRESPDAAMDAVTRGEADAAVTDAISLALFDGSGGELIAVGQPLRSDPYVIVVPRGALLLLDDLNRALSAMDADGTLASLRGKWLGP
jgi:ABC-type amino acid transport substrate-binding protein